MNKEKKIYVAGHTGMVGSAICRCLEQRGYHNIITRTSHELDLRSQTEVNQFFQQESPEYVFLAAAKVGGIGANSSKPAEFIYDNLMIQTNIIHAAYKANVDKLIFLGSSCIYPKFAPQPLKEEYLLSGLLEPTNEPYAIAKIAGIKMCQAYNRQYGTNYMSVMPTNLYGPNDNFDLVSSHVLPALIRKFHEVKMNKHSSVTIWGSGEPKREFLHVDDLADAVVFLMEKYDAKDISELINIGTGVDITIKQLAEIIKGITDYQGELLFDASQPNGTPRKLLDVSQISKLGWRASIELEVGIRDTWKWYAEHYKDNCRIGDSV